MADRLPITASEYRVTRYVLGAAHELVVEVALPLREPAHDGVLVLLGQLLLHLSLQPTQEKRTQHLR